MARRRYQKGSLSQRGKREKVWVGRFLDDEYQGEHRHRKYRSIVLGTVKELPTKKLAQRKLDEHLTRVNSLQYRPSHQLTFRDLATKWRTTILPTHKPSSQSSELAHLVRLNEFFGDIDVHKITGETVQRFVNSQQSAPKYVQNMVTTFRMIWKMAFDYEYVERDERMILRSVRLPVIGLQEQPTLGPDDAKRIISAAEEPFKTMFWLIAETGIRGGEAVALSADDIDLEQQVLLVRRSAYRGRLQTTKSKNGVRTFMLSPNLTNHLREYLSTWQDNPDRLLFHTRENTPFANQDIVNHRLHPIMDSLGITRPKRMGLHALRHGAATILDRLNAPLAVRRERMGHASMNTTMKYTHIDSKDHRDLALELGQIFDPNMTQDRVESVI